MSLSDLELPDLLPPRPPKPIWTRTLYVAGAVVCFALGVVGWLIPVVTGVPFYIAGLVLLAAASERARGWINHAERRKLPLSWRLKFRAALERWKSKKSHERKGGGNEAAK